MRWTLQYIPVLIVHLREMIYKEVSQMKRAALYVRVSTQEQAKHGLSVDNQVDALQQFCEDSHYLVAGVYNDAGYSARKKYTSRPALLRLIQDCQSGKVDVILFTKLDRWFRSVPDYYEVQTQLDACGVPWRAIWEDYETETSSGIFKVNIMLSVAQAEAQRTSERIKAVHEYRRAQGKYVGTAPLGYKLVNSELIIDEEKREAVSACFHTYLTTMSMSKTMETAKEYGLLMTKGHMARWMKKTCYCGDAYGYKCEPYITVEQHDRIVKAFASHRRTAKDNRSYLFSGLLKCGHCGYSLAAQTRVRKHADGSTVTSYAYKCPAYNDTSIEHHFLHVTEGAMEAYLLEHLDDRLRALRINVEARKKQNSRVTQVKRKKALAAKLERLKELFVDGDISKDEYTSRKNALQLEIDSIVIEDDADITLPDNWRAIYDALDRPHRKMFWASIIDKIVITRDTKQNPDIFFISGGLTHQQH